MDLRPPSFFTKHHAYALSFFLFLLTSILLTNYFNPIDLHSFPRIGFWLPFQYKDENYSANNIDSLSNRCDYSDGRWVWDESYPGRKYNESCEFLDPGFRCHKNGRLDQSFRNWRWQPHHCDLPRFNATDFLNRARNGRIVFAGDSIGRNQWESLLCMLAQGVTNKSTICEVNGVPITRHKGYFSVKFDNYNLTIEYYRVPFLVQVGRPPRDSPESVKNAVMVDHLHWYSSKWVGAHVLVFNDGHWWNKDKTKDGGIYFEEGDKINITMDYNEAFRRSLRTWKSWAEHNLDTHKAHIFFRGFSPIHFRNGTWNTGGTCRYNKGPSTNQARLQEEPKYNEYISNVIKEMEDEKIKAKYLNITYLSEFRLDGHPSVHREPGTAPVIEDCSHWCLPGVPDTWNEILYSLLLDQGFST